MLRLWRPGQPWLKRLLFPHFMHGFWRSPLTSGSHFPHRNDGTWVCWEKKEHNDVVKTLGVGAGTKQVLSGDEDGG